MYGPPPATDPGHLRKKMFSHFSPFCLNRFPSFQLFKSTQALDLKVGHLKEKGRNPGIH